MTTGPQMYQALKQATSELGVGSEFSVCPSDFSDLRKLVVDDLLAVGYSRQAAEEVVRDLTSRRIDRLGQRMGLKLKVVKEAPLLLPGPVS